MLLMFLCSFIVLVAVSLCLLFLCLVLISSFSQSSQKSGNTFVSEVADLLKPTLFYLR